VSMGCSIYEKLLYLFYFLFCLRSQEPKFQCIKYATGNRYMIKIVILTTKGMLNPEQTNNNSKSNFDLRLHLFNSIHYKEKKGKH
jgi:hypothetical protein